MLVTAEDDLRKHAKVLLMLLQYELPDSLEFFGSEERRQAFWDATDKLEDILKRIDYAGS